MTTYLESAIAESAQLIEPTPVAAGFGPTLILIDTDSGDIPSAPGQVASYGSPTAVDAAVTAGDLSVLEAAHVKAALGQNRRADVVYVAAYDSGTATETPDDALDRFVALAVSEVAIVTSVVKTDAANSAVSTWVAASNRRRVNFFAIVQSAAAGLLTGTFPSGLAACQDRSTRGLYHDDDDEPLAAAYAGFLSGHAAALRGPPNAELQIQGVALPPVTEAQLGFLLGNDFGTLLSAQPGAAASQRYTRGVTMADGASMSGWLATIFAVRASRTGLRNLLLRKAQTGTILAKSVGGRLQIQAACAGPLADLQAAEEPFFQPGSYGVAPNQIDLPDGYDVIVQSVDDKAVTTLQLLVAGQYASFDLNGEAEVIA